ncbi:MAG: LpxI family protein [Alphaproteobacteria bacterium]
MNAQGKLGIVAGGGELPIEIAESVREAGGDVFILALEGIASAAGIERYPHAWGSIGEVGKGLRLLREAGVQSVTLAGKVPRPQWNAIKLDARGATTFAKVLAAATKGDDAILRTMVSVFETDGFRVVGTAEAAPGLLMAHGKLGRHAPNAAQQRDIDLGAAIIRATGTFDIGQAVAICEGLVLAIEAAEGTDAMISRIRELPLNLRGAPSEHRGVLVKAAKPRQERRVDLPVIGPGTVALAAEAGLAGIALEAGAGLVMKRQACTADADRLGLFLFGFDARISPE